MQDSDTAAQPSPVPPQQALFRQEVFASKNAQWIGAIRLAQPVSSALIACCAVAIAALLLAFITWGSFTKKARISGITTPAGGSLTISALNAGVLVRSHVREGQRVREGQVLFDLSMERQGSKGEITALIGQQLAIRKQTLETERMTRIAQDNDKRRSVEARLINWNMEAEQIDQELVLAQKRLALAQKSLEKFETLQSSGFVSPTQSQQKLEDVLDLTSRISTLTRTRVQLTSARMSLESEKNDVTANHQSMMAQLDRAVASLDQELAENQNRKASQIVAPHDGVITTVTYQAGQLVNAGQVLATLIPDDAASAAGSELQVHLYAHSRTAGFVAPGQEVLIRYQAYPYQKFGLQQGTIIDVSKTPFAPNELPSNVASTILSNAQQNIHGVNPNEGMYRIKVRLARQTIKTYGSEQALKPGMTLDADVQQDRRKIWEWILEPVLASLPAR
ncbi:HlyD family secretion protein [Massilia aquatica]|uniref:HlyD family efflux transporter periplasmic adaptor subunit n=1 Tax=Massilia aquatica TaxID=2609000 RepID=A0ABX0M625_9BURK|nr:HlyD family efflux transporter periplasmic adaptor subunit [Massilia aquatica]NHZ39960.1 HlyD family efflux transporter periplasmic adaptor subunit [Massilia aquatica]